MHVRREAPGLVFSSAIFLFVFLPVFFAIYFLVPFRVKTSVVLAGSLVFYAWWRIDVLALLALVVVANYGLGAAIHRAPDRGRARRLLVLAVTLDLGILFFFKYANFFAESFAAAFSFGATLPPFLGEVILPLGISFYIFEAISYVVDMYRKDAEPARNLCEFAAFVTLFPHLVAGPVFRYKEIAPQFRHRTHSLDRFGEGAARFLLGLAKKVLVADGVAPLADAMFALPDPTFAESWLGALAYTVQLYFDFSGYSAMAVGLGLMMGFRLPENFRFPYHARSITDFWRRWHLSLSAWLRDYLYVPLGGSRRGRRRTTLNLLLTMLLGGLWHGAAWTFVLWGALHGALLALERAARLDPDRAPLWRIAPTMAAVVAGWVLFRAESLAGAGAMFRGMIGLNGFGLRPEQAWQVSGEALATLALGLLVAAAEPRLWRLWPDASPVAPARPRGTATAGLAAACLGVLAVAKLVADSDSPFLYFQF